MKLEVNAWFDYVYTYQIWSEEVENYNRVTYKQFQRLFPILYDKEGSLSIKKMKLKKYASIYGICFHLQAHINVFVFQLWM